MKNDHLVPFNKPFIVGKELYNIAQTVIDGMTSGDGPFTRRCQVLMEGSFSAQRVLLTHSCTAALEMAALLSRVGPDDEVILPSYTFVSTANAFYLRGARLVFADIRPDTLNIDESALPGLVTDKTRVIVPVHYAGVACDMDPILSLAGERDLLVVEDAAQGVNATYKDKFLGTIGHMGTYSFHETKNVISGEGGALAINDPSLVERAEIVREKGTNRSKFLRGEVDKYTWVDLGSSYLPSEMIAAFLHAQLERMDEITARRQSIYSHYDAELKPLAGAGYFGTPTLPTNICSPNFAMYYLILKDKDERNALIEYLREHRIQAVFHYVPLHLSRVGRSLGYGPGDCPVTESMASRLVRLPFFYGMTLEQQNLVVNHIKQFFNV